MYSNCSISSEKNTSYYTARLLSRPIIGNTKGPQGLTACSWKLRALIPECEPRVLALWLTFSCHWGLVSHLYFGRLEIWTKFQQRTTAAVLCITLSCPIQIVLNAFINHTKSLTKNLEIDRSFDFNSIFNGGARDNERIPCTVRQFGWRKAFTRDPKVDDPEGIWTLSLLIWSQLRYRCATRPTRMPLCFPWYLTPSAHISIPAFTDCPPIFPAHRKYDTYSTCNPPTIFIQLTSFQITVHPPVVIWSRKWPAHMWLERT